MERTIAVLHFTEANAPDTSLTTDVVIKTDLADKEIDVLIVAISNVKEHADNEEPISGFDIPDNWDDYGWDEKIQKVCEHMSLFTGRYSVVKAHVATVEVN